MREDELLSVMSNIGQCYESDLRLAMGTDGHVSDVINRLIEKGYIARSQLLCPDDPHREFVNVLLITYSGRIRLSDKRQDNDYNVKIGKFVNKRFNVKLPTDLHRELSYSRLLLEMYQAGIRVFPDDKPSLLRLYSETKGKNYVSKNEWMYSDFLELKHILSGVFYTKDEVRELIAINNPQDDINVKGARFKGVYFDGERTCLVYQPDIFKNRTLSLNEGIEKRTIKILENTFRYFNYADYMDAMVLTNGSALITDMGIGGKEGTIKEKTIKETGFVKNRKILLNFNCSLFKNIYCFPHTKDGIRQLKYFVSHKKEDLLADTLSICDRTQAFTPMPEIIDHIIDQDLVIKNSKTGASAIYIPYYNIKQLKEISGFYEELTIITSPYMADRLSHIIRRTNPFFDIDGNPIQVKQYQKNGRPVGVEAPKKKQKRKPKMQRINVELTLDDYKGLKKICNYKNITMAKFIRNYLKPAIKEEMGTYSKLIELQEEMNKVMDGVMVHNKG